MELIKSVKFFALLAVMAIILVCAYLLCQCSSWIYQIIATCFFRVIDACLTIAIRDFTCNNTHAVRQASNSGQIVGSFNQLKGSRDSSLALVGNGKLLMIQARSSNLKIKIY